jgi:hypothetical protein
MTKEWKAGDLAMVRVDRMNGRDASLVGSSGYSIDVGSLHPLPPAMTAAEAALVEACIAEMPEWSTGFGGSVSRIHPIYGLTQAVLVERAPPDPVEVAIAVWRSGERSPAYTEENAVRAALKAYDAAKEKKS